MQTQSFTTYLNGDFVSSDEAKISPLDRGFVLGDGVYEVLPVINGNIIHLTEHLQRLNASLSAIRMAPPHSEAEWIQILEALVKKNGGGNQWMYLQVTRGFDLIRSHEFPKEVRPTVFAISYPKVLDSKDTLRQGIKVMPVPDIRWKYCNIKTTARLAYVLMYQSAKEAGFNEGIIINNGVALEGCSSNIFLVREGILLTPPKSPAILPGITRDSILKLAKAEGIPYRETEILETDLYQADELWITSAIRGIFPVIEIAGRPVGTGKAGPLWERMWDIYMKSLGLQL